MPINPSRALLGAVLLTLQVWSASANAEAPLALLPLKRVRLYEVGMGYFERSGVLRDKAELGLSLPPSQLNDALASLVILRGSGQARIADIEFESHESPGLARAEASLTGDADAPLEFASVLRSFRGVEVEVRQRAGAVRGRLVDVIPLDKASAERCVAQKERTAAEAGAPCSDIRDASLVVLNKDGTLSRVALNQVESVRALDPAVASRLSRALDAVSHRSASPGRRILHVHGSGSAALALGYIAEAPVWRASYRLLLEDSGTQGRIQGFALVHNDTDEAWHGVKLELVNGRPSSFMYPLAAPRYARRQLLTPEEELSTIPQLLGKSADELWGDEEQGETVAAGGISLRGVGEGGGGRGEGIGLGSIGSIGHGAGTSDLLAVGNLSDLAAAGGIEGAAQFTYRMTQPIELGAHASALVPFVSEGLALTRVTWFESDEAGETAVRLLNSSPQTLPAGVITIYAEAGFSGASLLPRTKPGETRLLRFGRDLDVELERSVISRTLEPKLYAFENGQLTEHGLQRSQVRFQLHNKSRSERTVSVALDVVENARISGADEAAYDSNLGRGIVSFQLPAHNDSTRELQIVEGVRAPAKISAESLGHAASLSSIDPMQRLILERAAREQHLVEIRRGALPKRSAEMAEALSDVTRLESHVRALGSNSAEGRLAAQRLRQTEDLVLQLRRRIATLNSELVAHEARTREILSELGSAKPLSPAPGAESSAG
ncbi:MAG: DUF4139 domain-containing protein [Polyangiaceae bacterium]